MFSAEAKIIYYVKNVRKSADFWQKIGFAEREAEVSEGTLVYETSPTPDCPWRLALYDRKYFEDYAAESITPSPAIIFSTPNIEVLYEKMQKLGIDLGGLMHVGDHDIFNFVDPDGNTFAVSSEFD